MKKLIFIAGGGSGGHIYPAIAIAEKIKSNHPGAEVRFIGTRQGLETKIIPREGYPISYISARAMNSLGIKAKMAALFFLILGIFQSVLLIIKYNPSVILGVGGYASGPMMLAAVLLRRNTAVFEPNAYPGLTNRTLAPFVKLAFINFSVTAPVFKNSHLFGFPVREAVEKSLSQVKIQNENNPEKNTLNILIFGGSQGARGINRTVFEALSQQPEKFQGLKIVHQIGSTDWNHFDSEYKKLKPSFVEHFEFPFDMPLRYAWADLVVCRAGAATLAELACLRKSAVLVPFPHAADNHQQKNAEALVQKGAAKMILQEDFTAERFIQEIQEFKNDPKSFYNLQNNIGSFFIRGAAAKITDQLMLFK